ncbi:MAG: hypothetical protein ACO222_01870 [Polynucleobacter sp.]
MADPSAYQPIDLDAFNQNIKQQEQEVRRQQAEQLQARQQEVQKQAQQQKQTKAKKEQKFQQSLTSLIPQQQPGAPLEGVAKWMEENLAIPAVDLVDNLFQGNQRTPEQIAKERQQARTGFQQRLQEGQRQFEEETYKAPVTAAVAETTRVLGGALVKPVEGVLDIGYQAYLDATVNRGKRPDDETYKRAYTELVKAPKTEIGLTAERLLAMFMTIRGLRNIPGAKLGTAPISKELKGFARLGARGKKAALEGLVPGIIADILLTDAKEGNLSEVVKDLVPEAWRDSFVLGMATDKYQGNPFENRIKSGLGEGPVFNAAFNVAAPAIGVFYRAFRRLVKGGADPVTALRRSAEEASQVGDDALQSSSKAAASEMTEAVQVKYKQLELLDQDEARITQELANEIDPDNVRQLELDLDDINTKRQDISNQLDRDLDPTTKRYPHEDNRSVDTTDINRVAATQMNLEEGFPGIGKVSTHGHAGKVLTEAAAESVGLEKGTTGRQILDKFSKMVDVEQIAKDSKFTVGQVLTNATRVVDDFLDGIKRFDDFYGGDQGELVGRLMSQVGDVGKLAQSQRTVVAPETLVATKALVADMANQIYDLSLKATANDLAQFAGFREYERMVDRFVGLLEFYKTGTQFLGGGLNTLKLSVIDNLSEREAAQLLSKYEVDEDAAMTIFRLRKYAKEAKDAYRRGDADGVEKMRQLARGMILAGGDPAKTLNFARTALDLGLKVQTRNFYNSILSGVKTMFRNGGTFYRLIEGPTSIALKGFASGDEAYLKAAAAGYSSIIKGIGEASSVAARTWKTRIPMQATPKQMIYRTESLAMLENLEQTVETPMELIAVKLLKMHYRVAEALAIPERVMMTMDDYFKTILARQRINEMAAFEAFNEDPNNWEKVVATKLQKFGNAIDPNTGTIKSAGIAEYADIGTFQNDPGGLANLVSMMAEKLPIIGKAIVPFVRTPANILTYQLEHMPGLALVSQNYQRALKSEDPLLIAEHEGRQAVGAFAMITASAMASQGLITGNMPNPKVEPEEFKRWKELGIKPRSFNFNGIYVSYNMVEPLSNLVAMAADLTRVGQTYGLSEGWMDRMGAVAMMTIHGTFVDKSYFSAIAGIGELSQLESWNDKATRATVMFINNQFPVAGFRRMLGNMADQYQREYSNEFDRSLQAALPFYRNYRPAQISVFTGKPMKNPNGGPGFLGIYNASIPFEIGVGTEDPVVDMMQAIGYKWKDDLEKDPTGLPYSAEDKEFIRRTMFEQGIRTQLEAEMKKPYFKEDLNEWKSRKLGPNRKYHKSETPIVYDNVQRIWNSNLEFARQKLREQNAQLGDNVQNIMKEKYQLRQGNYQLDKPKDYSDRTVTTQTEEGIKTLIGY